MTVLASVAARPKSILFATDFSSSSEKTVQHALAIARHYRSRFCMAHVISSVGFAIAGPEAVETATEAAWRDAARWENRLAESGAFGAIPHKAFILRGKIWDELERVIQQEQIDLIVIATHGRRGLKKMVLGSVAEEIYRRASCPVLTVGPYASDTPAPEDTLPGPLLFATDFGEASGHAFPYAVTFANEYRVPLILLHVVPEVPLPEGPHWHMAGDIMRLRENARAVTLERLHKMASECSLIYASQSRVEFGLPSEQIVKTAHEVDAAGIILGVKRARYAGVASHTPWHTATEVVGTAMCPVLTLKS